MPRRTKPSKPPVTWIVVLRANLDDDIAGAFPTFQQARALMQRLATAEAAQAEQDENKMVTQFGGSGLIAVAVYRVQGTKVEHWAQVGIDYEDREAA